MYPQTPVSSNGPESVLWGGIQLHCEQKPGGAEAMGPSAIPGFP